MTRYRKYLFIAYQIIAVANIVLLCVVGIYREVPLVFTSAILLLTILIIQFLFFYPFDQSNSCQNNGCNNRTPKSPFKNSSNDHFPIFRMLKKPCDINNIMNRTKHTEENQDKCQPITN